MVFGMNKKAWYNTFNTVNTHSKNQKNFFVKIFSKKISCISYTNLSFDWKHENKL